MVRPSLLALLPLLAALPACGERSHGTRVPLHTLRGRTMGTTWSVKVLGATAAPAALERAIQATLDAVDARMSTYKDDSELSRLNRHAGRDPFRVSGALFEVLQVARDVAARSEGAFDITVGPLVDAWGFGPRGRPTRVPADETLLALRARVGRHRIDLVAGDEPTVRKTAPAVSCDLAGVAKGYAVDRVADVLRGVRGYLIDVGGEIRAAGVGPDDVAWKVAVEMPDGNGAVAARVVPLRDMAMATSGDYRNYYEEQGRRFSHLIDPRTGRPITHALASVSVLHARCDVADAWATALMVLGPEEGLDLAEREGLAAFFLVRAEARFVGRGTKAFEALADVEVPTR